MKTYKFRRYSFLRKGDWFFDLIPMVFIGYQETGYTATTDIGFGWLFWCGVLEIERKIRNS